MSNGIKTNLTDCPFCSGTGRNPVQINFSNIVCRYCNGTGIIARLSLTEFNAFNEALKAARKLLDNPSIGDFGAGCSEYLAFDRGTLQAKLKAFSDAIATIEAINA